jgi:predicted transcriptional regulator
VNKPFIQLLHEYLRDKHSADDFTADVSYKFGLAKHVSRKAIRGQLKLLAEKGLIEKVGSIKNLHGGGDHPIYRVVEGAEYVKNVKPFGSTLNKFSIEASLLVQNYTLRMPNNLTDVKAVL